MISVVIPTYKRPEFLRRLLASIAAQSYQPQEVIVVDDASGMDAAYQATIADFQAQLRGLIYHRLPENRGAPHARNFGIQRARRDWIALVDDDDEWLPDKLARQWQYAQQAPPQLGLIYTWARAVGSPTQDAYVSARAVQGDARAEILRGNFVVSASVLVRKSALSKAGLFDETLPSCQDWDMWTRVFLAGYQCDFIPEILTLYHRHGGDSIGLSVDASQGYLIYLRKHVGAILCHTGPLNWARKLALYARLRVGAHG